MNPLPSVLPELDPARYGLSTSQQYQTQGILFGNAAATMTLDQVHAYLQSVYSKYIGYEFSHLQVREPFL
jgi:2-oxoglutarate dehydrogenase complex dehydrogenase (E1) component-like enzyme